METADSYANLVAEFQRRFPLIDKITGLFGEDIPAETVPWFFGFFLAASEQRKPGACCFVFDKTHGTTAIASVLWALTNFQRDFPDMVKRHTQNAFSIGERVRVKPNNFVYEYDGIWEQSPRLFKLRLLGSEKDKRAFPIEEIMRLESTDRLRPKGKLNSKLGDFERGPLGDLLELPECGNKNLIENKTLILMEQTRFERFLDSTVFAPLRVHVEQFPNLSSFLSVGSIASDGSLKAKDSCEPMIAVTSSPEYLASVCLGATPGTKTVFVDGAKRIASNLQAFDNIVGCQSMVILAALGEVEYVDQLRERNCSVWRMSPREMLAGESLINVRMRKRKSLAGSTVRAADIRLRGKITTVDCEDPVLQHLAELLGRAMEMVRDNEESSEAEKIIGNLLGILLDYSECCFGVGDATTENLAAVKKHFMECEKYLEEEVKNVVGEAVDGFEQLAESRDGGNKADVLLDILSNCEGNWVLTARSVRTAECLREKLGLRDGLEIKRIPEIGLESEYAGVIVPAWPNKWNFAKLISMALARDVRVLAYPFESELVTRHKKQHEHRSLSGQIRMEECALILGVESGLLPEQPEEKNDNEETPRAETETKEFSFLDFENRIRRNRYRRPVGITDYKDVREARTVYFFGECHAFLTEWVRLPVLNELVYKSAEENPRLLQKIPSELSPGDFVLFQAGGDKEFIRLVAERILGEEQYRETRKTAEIWKQALWDLGDNAEVVHAELAKRGLKKSSATIANWFANPDLIAPMKYEDVEVIAGAAGHEELILRKEEVKAAIDEIRNAHRLAGRELSRLILSGLRSSGLGELDEQPVFQDFGYGAAWIVQVELVESALETCGAGEVNRLLWSDEDG